MKQVFIMETKSHLRLALSTALSLGAKIASNINTK
jgi:hypothetical protein